MSNKEFHKNPVPMIAIALAMAVLLTLVSYTEQEPKTDTNTAVVVNCPDTGTPVDFEELCDIELVAIR